MPLSTGTGQSTPDTTRKKRLEVKRTSIRAKSGPIQFAGGNDNRVGLTVFNHSNYSIYLDTDRKLSVEEFMVELPPGAYFEMPFRSTPELWALWELADGQASVRELIEF